MVGFLSCSSVSLSMVSYSVVLTAEISPKTCMTHGGWSSCVQTNRTVDHRAASAWVIWPVVSLQDTTWECALLLQRRTCSTFTRWVDSVRRIRTCICSDTWTFSCSGTWYSTLLGTWIYMHLGTQISSCSGTWTSMFPRTSMSWTCLSFETLTFMCSRTWTYLCSRTLLFTYSETSMCSGIWTSSGSRTWACLKLMLQTLNILMFPQPHHHTR